ncbi:MAG TPA: hypothetical protein VLG10_15775 [Methylomirabilota bacterium]|nr:hypothetical protein [Methylomirabilota bacterium]
MNGSSRRTARFLASVLLLLLPACPVAGSTFTPIFTKQYVRADGPPVTVSDAFSVCDPGGTFRLIVLNGPGGHDRVSSGSIVLNGIEVVHERNFHQRIAKIERPLQNVREENLLEVHLGSKPGVAITVSVESRQSCEIRITSPIPGSILTEPKVIVRGTVQTRPGANTGVTVNGVPALVEVGQFAALVPVNPELTALTARAVDPSGDVGADTIPVAVQLSSQEPRLRLQASPAGGVGPLTVGFSVSSLIPAHTTALDFDGDGAVDFTGQSLEGQTFTYQQPGIYTATVRITDERGGVHTTATVVPVSDQAALDARLQAIWHGLKDALRAGDLARASTFIHSETRAAYADQLNRFSPTTLASIDTHMTTIQLVEVGPGGAQYEMLRDRDGQTLSFAVWFQLDQDGLWRLRRF